MRKGGGRIIWCMDIWWVFYVELTKICIIANWVKRFPPTYMGKGKGKGKGMGKGKRKGKGKGTRLSYRHLQKNKP